MSEAEERRVLTADLLGAGLALGWFPDTLEAWEFWCSGAPLEVLRNRVNLSQARAEAIDPSRKYARMGEEAAAYLVQTMTARRYPPERIEKARTWAETATLRDIVGMALKVKEGK